MKIVKIKGKIELLSGLHIGGGDDTMHIGGIDSGVVKDLNTKKPYIPGSSLKGKMRSLLEWNYGLVGISDGNPFSAKYLDDSKFNNSEDRKNAINLLKLFGDSGSDNKRIDNEIGITRISVGDCKLSDNQENMILSEAKYENVIDRQKGTSNNIRQIERVPAGVKFDYDIRVKILDEDNEKELIKMLNKGIKLIEDDYIGGSGSRGYGRVQFKEDE